MYIRLLKNCMDKIENSRGIQIGFPLLFFSFNAEGIDSIFPHLNRVNFPNREYNESNSTSMNIEG